MEPAFVSGAALSALGVFAVLLNLVVLVALWRRRGRRRFSTAPLFSLAAADLGIAICGCPAAAAAAFEGRWLWGERGCQFYGFQGLFFGLASIMSVAFIQHRRYVALCKNGAHDHTAYTCFIWLYAAFFAAAPLFGWHRYAMEPLGRSCTIDYQDNSLSFVSYLSCIFVFSYVAPLAAMIYWETAIRRGSVVATKEDIEKALGTSRTALGLVAVILLCWSPYAVVCLWSALVGAASLPPWCVEMAPISAKSAPVLDPLIFLTIPEVRDAVASLVGKDNGSRAKQN